MIDNLEIPACLRRSLWTPAQWAAHAAAQALPTSCAATDEPVRDWRRPRGVDDATWDAHLAAERRKQQAENARLNALPKKERT